MNQKSFQNAERDFLLLKGQLATNRITQAQFDTALEKLNVRDEYGRAWRMEAENGAWEINQDGTWFPADPKIFPAPAVSSTNTQNKTSSNNLFIFIALGVILFLCVCGLGAYALLNATGILTTQVNLFRTATPTWVALATPTLPPTPPSDTAAPPQPTILTPDYTATPFDVPKDGTAQPTTTIPQTFPAFDADFFADECPLFEGSNETREYACTFGEYAMLHKQATTRYTFYDAVYDDAVVEATGYLLEGTGKYEYGVVVRANTDGTQYYVFTVTNDGRYNVALYKDAKYTDLIPYTASPLVNTGESANSFKVILFGKQMIFYLNDQFIGIVPDEILERGVAGLFFYNAEPNAQVGFDQFTISTFSPPTPTATADANATAAPETPIIATATGAAKLPTTVVQPGVYVNSLRFSPRAPKRGEPVTFFATFVNSTGKPQNYKWLVEIWEQDANKKNPYGQADGLAQQIPSGTGELATGDSWKVAGGGPCISFRARVVYADDQTRRIPFKRTNGADLWVNFQVCP